MHSIGGEFEETWELAKLICTKGYDTMDDSRQLIESWTPKMRAVYLTCSLTIGTGFGF